MASLESHCTRAQSALCRQTCKISWYIESRSRIVARVVHTDHQWLATSGRPPVAGHQRQTHFSRCPLKSFLQFRALAKIDLQHLFAMISSVSNNWGLDEIQ